MPPGHVPDRCGAMRSRHRVPGSIVVASLLCLACTSPPDSDPTERLPATARPPAGMAWVIFPTDTVLAEVAADAASRYRGLRFRQSLADGNGMVFLFDAPGVRQFTMSDTYIPLDIAFVGADMTIGEIIPMMPQVEGPYESTVEALLAVEVPQGWFADHGIEVGTPVEIEFGS